MVFGIPFFINFKAILRKDNLDFSVHSSKQHTLWKGATTNTVPQGETGRRGEKQISLSLQ